MPAHYQIIKSSKENFKGIQMGKKKGLFNSGGIIKTNDATLANDIRQKFGQDRTGTGDVIVARVPNKTTGSRFAVGISFDENGNRI